jgi:hypothetical protein
MDENERKKIAEALAKADEPTLKEIVREAESFLEAQLKAGLAADARAMTLAGFVAAILSISVAGTGLMVAARIPIWPHAIATIVLAIFLCLALASTVYAARPTHWSYTGNNPKFWISDIEKGRSLNQALVGQASLYARGITKNKEILDENQRYSWLAIKLVGFGAVLALAIEGLVIFIQLGSP